MKASLYSSLRSRNCSLWMASDWICSCRIEYSRLSFSICSLSIYSPHNISESKIYKLSPSDRTSNSVVEFVRILQPIFNLALTVT